MVATLIALALGQQSLDARIADILPTASEEKWLSIGWRTDLSAARADAQREGKPIFLWIMNGHPCGCT